MQHLDTACSTGEHVILYIEGDVVKSLFFLAASLSVFSGVVNNVGVPVRVQRPRRQQQANSAAAAVEVLQTQHEEAT